MSKKPSYRALACQIAKEIAQEKGGTPASHMKEAWAKAKSQPLPTEEKLPELANEFFSVTYKMMKGRQKSIVPSKSPEEACRKFYDPDDENGPKHEIIDCTRPKKIPRGWTIAFKNGSGIANAVLEKDIPLDKNTKFTAKLRGKEVLVTTADILGANPAKKARVMS